MFAGLGWIGLAAASLGAAEALDYNRDIRPILSENCFACHGFDEKGRKGKLRLDQAESAYAEREGVVRIKPGDSAGSEVWQRITSAHEDEVMPPPDSHSKLTDAQKQKIKTWIEQGAKYASHWSLVAPRKAAVPSASDGEKERMREGGTISSLRLSLSPSLNLGANAIDAFVRANLAESKMTPAPDADRAMLLRRVSFDLTGLPPSAEEVAAFVADRDPQAYAKLVDRLLASPHFGERMALDWLDAARYADTNGFSIDGGRHMWLWRDWVIQAFNDNMPYDRFLVEQLAGDLLPNRTDAQLIATGFQRNNMVTHEGGTIPEENLTNYNVDRVKTLGESVLGLTLGCAQCHDHKFDPITQKDYFGIYAFFNTLSDKGLDGNAGVNPGPMMKAKTVLRTTEEPKLREEIAALEATLAKPDAGVLARWEKQQREILATSGQGLALHPITVNTVSTPNRGSGFEREGESGVKLVEAGGLAAYDIATTLPKTREPITGLRVVFHPVPGAPGGGWGYGPTGAVRPKQKAKQAAGAAEMGDDGKPKKGTFMVTAIAATADAVAGDQVNLHKLLPIARVTASSWEKANPASACLDPRNETGWSPDIASEGPVHLTVTFAQPIRPEATPHFTVQVNFGNGKGLIAGHLEFFAVTGTDDGTELPADVLATIGTPPAQRSAETVARLWAHCATVAPELEAKRVALANLQERRAVLTEPFTTMVMDVAAKPRDTFLLNRGDYAQPTVKMAAATPASLPPMPVGATPDRLGLAQWIVMKEHPLTARVAVNRLWKLCFGTGIVATSADLGSQGEWPTQPELLDWLAVDFVERGWDVKAMLRQIVLSQTYRQTSASSAEALERDPQNRRLARGPRFRLHAEAIRDAALKVSGLLVPRVGGPSVNPYAPGDLWREISHYGSSPATAQTFVQDHGEKLYRRSMYTYWKRTAPPPNMMAFDAPNREVCTVARPDTTTPLQALVTLNDPQFVEAARVLAERILARGDAKERRSEGETERGGGDTARLSWGFVEALSREPSANEIAVLAKTLARERKRYAADPRAAEKFLAVGESPRNAKLAPEEHAAWAQVATLLLNLSETVTRN